VLAPSKLFKETLESRDLARKTFGAEVLLERLLLCPHHAAWRPVDYQRAEHHIPTKLTDDGCLERKPFRNLPEIKGANISRNQDRTALTIHLGVVISLITSARRA
jgi:hypothetical protein